MDTGKMMMGIAQDLLLTGGQVSRSTATGCDASRLVGSRIAVSAADSLVPPYAPFEQDDTAPTCYILLQKYPSQERTMTCTAPVISESSLSQPHTSMNDDLSMHMPCFSSLRIVYHHHSGPYPGQSRTGSHTWPSLTPEIRRSQSLLESYIQAT